MALNPQDPMSTTVKPRGKWRHTRTTIETAEQQTLPSNIHSTTALAGVRQPHGRGYASERAPIAKPRSPGSRTDLLPELAIQIALVVVAEQLRVVAEDSHRRRASRDLWGK